MNKLFSMGVIFTFLLASCGGGGSLPSVKIGKQTWSAKNLDVTTFRNGDAIGEVKTAAEWKAAGKAGKPAYCSLNFNAANDANYGKLYNWFAVTDPRGLAPKGWHIPSGDEWVFLEFAVSKDGENVGAKMLKSHTGWKNNYKGSSGNGEGELGFLAPAGGHQGEDGSFYEEGQSVYWWSTSFQQSDSERIVNFGILNSHDIQTGFFPKESGNYVRCVKDE
jgi:uncharacterized protein (TIGR02145 family)